jgi:hypothetical protein
MGFHVQVLFSIDSLFHLRNTEDGSPMPRWKFICFLAILGWVSVPLAPQAEERLAGEGEHRGFILQEGEQVLVVNSIKPGQTIQAHVAPQWSVEKEGRVEWVLTDGSGNKLRAGSHHQPEEAPLLLEWTSNSQPRPDSFRIQIRGKGAGFPGEILGQYVVQLSLWDQNDGSSGTDAPETYEKALELPLSDPGLHIFNEGFISGTADIYDIYKISLKPNHSLTLKAVPVQWKGSDKRGKVRWDFLNRSFKRMKDGQNSLSEPSPFVVRVFHPQVKSANKPATFYLLVKIEGEVSLIYSLQAEVKEGR